MNFKLQPGDYIFTSEIPFDKRQAVIDAFVAAGAIMFDGFYFFEDMEDWDKIGWDHGESGLEMWSVFVDLENKPSEGYRRVTIDQILGEQSPSWDEIGPELLDALDDIIKSNDLGNAAIVNKLVFKAKQAVAKAKAVK